MRTPVRLGVSPAEYLIAVRKTVGSIIYSAVHPGSEVKLDAFLNCLYFSLCYLFDDRQRGGRYYTISAPMYRQNDSKGGEG